MTPSAIFAIGLGLFWLLLFLLHRAIEKHHPAWAQQLKQRRLVINYISTGVETDFFTPYIVKFATTWRKFTHLWFLTGAAFCSACFVLTLVYLIPSYLTTRFLRPSESPSVELEVIIPGITIPWTFVPHVMVAIFCTLAFHELGHALSGANDNKAIDAIGLIVQLFIPAAYVRFKEDHYDLSPWRQMKVYCAGAWHNFVLYALAWLIVTNSIFLFSPLYLPPSSGLTISYIKFNQDQAPFKVGDKVIGLNHCSISTEQEWGDCLSSFLVPSNQSKDYLPVCVPTDWIDSGSIDCCEQSYNGPIPCWQEARKDGRKFCRPARDVWHSKVHYCDATHPESPICTEEQGSHKCALPSLQDKYREAGLALLQVRVLKSDGTISLLHTRQHPYELLQQVSFVLFEPRWSWMPQWSSHAADHFYTICALLLNFNLITPIVSLLPIYGFDGEYLLYALTMWLAPSLDDEKREQGIDWVRKATTAVGLLIFLPTLLSVFK